MNKEHFFIVSRNRPNLEASKRHSAYHNAIKEAERLAKKENATFLVLEVAGYVYPATPPVSVIHLRSKRDVYERVARKEDIDELAY